ncbi:hypothetical protein C8R46DRAFT_1122365 [Mycena filopes]|nr:hypothetical protein C8R46DRAFT_1122365 [Mycena filopes]
MSDSKGIQVNPPQRTLFSPFQPSLGCLQHPTERQDAHPDARCTNQRSDNILTKEIKKWRRTNITRRRALGLPRLRDRFRHPILCLGGLGSLAIQREAGEGEEGGRPNNDSKYGQTEPELHPAYAAGSLHENPHPRLTQRTQRSQILQTDAWQSSPRTSAGCGCRVMFHRYRCKVRLLLLVHEFPSLYYSVIQSEGIKPPSTPASCNASQRRYTTPLTFSASASAVSRRH